MQITYKNSTTVVLNTFENFSVKQALTQSTLNSTQEFDGNDREATIPWLDQIEMVMERTGFDPLELGISKFKGLALGNVNTICKEEGLSWHKFRQHLIEQYSNIPNASDAMSAYSQITQQDDEPTAQNLIKAKALLEHILCTSKLPDISDTGLDNLFLISCLRDPQISRRVAKEQESWRTMEYIFKSINRSTRTEEQTRPIMNQSMMPYHKCLLGRFMR